MSKGQNGYLWAVGGKIGLSKVIDDVSVYNIEKDRWYSSSEGDLKPMPYAVQGAAYTLYEGKIFCFGGKTGTRSGWSKRVQVYEIKKDKWLQLDPLTEARSKLGKFYPVVDDRYVFIFGGDCTKGRYSRVKWNWRFDLKKGVWDFDVANAPRALSFPVCSYHKGWLYYTSGNTGKLPFNIYRGGVNQRYNPKTDKWEVLKPCPIPITDGGGDKWKDELHLVGGWNANPIYYNRFRGRYKGKVKKFHLVYNYETGDWREEEKLPGSLHHGGVRASKDYLWHYLGTRDEEVKLKGKLTRYTNKKIYKNQHTNKIFRWDGSKWEEKSPAPVRKMNFGCIYSKIGPS